MFFVYVKLISMTSLLFQIVSNIVKDLLQPGRRDTHLDLIQ